MTHFKTLEYCKICGNQELVDVIHFASQFLSSAFVASNQNNPLTEIQIPLTLTLCDRRKHPEHCGLLQLREEVKQDLLYRQYFYRSGTSDTMRADLKQVVEDVTKRVIVNKGDIAIDIGANDCTMLHFYPNQLKRVAFEPAQNIDWSHVDPSITVINDYFSGEAFQKRFPGKKAKIVSCCAMFYDLANPNQFVKDVESILSSDGLWCIQVSYLSLMLKNMNFYDICHEHLAYYSLATLRVLMKRNRMKIVDATTNTVNGGSLRVFVTHEENSLYDSKQGTKRLAELEVLETSLQLNDPNTYFAYEKQIHTLKDKVKRYIQNEIRQGYKVFGLGASTKGNILLQFFELTKDLIPYISERNSSKSGLKTLGTDIELIAEETARLKSPSCMLVLPWYFKNEIVKREQPYLKAGGKLLFPMPYAHIVDKNGEHLL